MSEYTREVVLTPEGLARLEQELEYLSTVRRREVANRLRHALETGGELSENAEYLDAKEEQARLEQRIARLEERLANARVVQAGQSPAGAVAIGTRVKLKDLDAKETLVYEIVGSGEGDPAQRKLSNESPLAKAIMGHRKGDVVEVPLPRGSRRVEILEVRRA